jgi:hypothetical protein
MSLEKFSSIFYNIWNHNSTFQVYFLQILSGQQNLHLKIASFYSIGEVWICYLKLQKARLWNQTNWIGNHNVLNISQVKPGYHDSKIVRLQTSEMQICENMNVLEAPVFWP